jgi:hypothetical protein
VRAHSSMSETETCTHTHAPLSLKIAPPPITHVLPSLSPSPSLLHSGRAPLSALKPPEREAASPGFGAGGQGFGRPPVPWAEEGQSSTATQGRGFRGARLKVRGVQGLGPSHSPPPRPPPPHLPHPHTSPHPSSLSPPPHRPTPFPPQGCAADVAQNAASAQLPQQGPSSNGEGMMRGKRVEGTRV